MTASLFINPRAKFSDLTPGPSPLGEGRKSEKMRFDVSHVPVKLATGYSARYFPFFLVKLAT